MHFETAVKVLQAMQQVSTGMFLHDTVLFHICSEEKIISPIAPLVDMSSEYYSKMYSEQSFFFGFAEM